MRSGCGHLSRQSLALGFCVVEMLGWVTSFMPCSVVVALDLRLLFVNVAIWSLPLKMFIKGLWPYFQWPMCRSV